MTWRQSFPIETDNARLELVSGGDEGRAVLRLIGFDDGQTRDVKEQEVYLVPGGLPGDGDRSARYWRAWRAHALELLATGAETLMPSDFLPTGRHPLTLEADTEAEFFALLKSPPGPAPLEPEAIAKAAAVARNPELEIAVGRADDDESLAVYADWLQEHADPLGQVLSTALAAGEWREVLGKNREVLVGPVEDYPDALAITWRRGMIDTIDVRATYEEPADCELLFESVLAVSSARLVRDITLGCFDFEGGNDYGRMAAAIASEVRPGLQSLFIGDVDSEEQEVSWIRTGDLGPIWPMTPNLRRLRVRSGEIELGAMSLPELRELVIETGGLGDVSSVAKADWPRLTSMEVWFGAEDYGAECTVGDLEDIFSGARLPKLTHLGLRNCEFVADITRAVAAAEILSRLRSLDLSMGVLEDNDAIWLLDNQAKFAHLESLDLSRNFLSPDVAARVESVSGWIAKQQKPDDGYRYVSVGE